MRCQELNDDVQSQFMKRNWCVKSIVLHCVTNVSCKSFVKSIRFSFLFFSPRHRKYRSFSSSWLIPLPFSASQCFLLPSSPLPPPLSSLIPPNYKLFPINFLFAKLNHHLLGLSLPSSYILASSLDASSCRTWDRYWRSVSASWREVGGLNICGRQSAPNERI